MNVSKLVFGAIVAASAASAGCRGDTSTEPPIHLIRDMDWQPKYHPEGESEFFADQRDMRPVVDGTVAQGHLDEDDAYYRGMKDGQFVAHIPPPAVVDEKLIARGQDRYNIYCTPCHSKTGDGHGIVARRTNWLAGNLNDDRIVKMGDGEIFNTITHGIRGNMPGYAAQIPVADRWAIISWVRVIQRSQHAALADVPADQTGHIEPEGPNP